MKSIQALEDAMIVGAMVWAMINCRCIVLI
jgi:hypothetical protein